MGSYSQTTAIYSEDNMELLYVLHGQMGGVTHVSDILLPVCVIVVVDLYLHEAHG